MSAAKPGLVVLFGSGESSPAASKAHEIVAQRLTGQLHIAILETPAGFEPNSAHVASKPAAFLKKRLQNHSPNIDIVAARKKGTPFSPDAPDILAPLWDANWLFLGAGSPTYAARQLRDSLALEMIAARHQLGAVLMLASSATLAFSNLTMPVYEIYKVGQDLHWQTGIDYFSRFGLSLVLIPHWNNAEGGKHLDTSRCFMGRDRFGQLQALLPENQTIVGLDEHTALVIDFEQALCHVIGLGRVTIQRASETAHFVEGEPFALDQLGEWHLPEAGVGVDTAVWQQALAAEAKPEAAHLPPAEVVDLVEMRTAARAAKNWQEADQLRDKLAQLGWQVNDTPTGSEIEPLSS